MQAAAATTSAGCSSWCDHDDHAAAAAQHDRCQQKQQRQKELHIAPMLHVSTIEFRSFMRLLSRRCVLWTEMVVDETLYYNRDKATGSVRVPQHLLDDCLASSAAAGAGGSSSDDIQPQPVVCQIGGIRPEWTAVATKLILEAGYTEQEINLNLDCPSNRVQGKQFGAVLMKHPDTALELLKAMHENAGDTPISVKCRIGVDDCTDFEWIVDLIERLSSTVCSRFVLHARPVLLQGLSPAQNRIVPALNYPFVYRICERFPHCDFILNGGIPGLQAAKEIAFGKPQESVVAAELVDDGNDSININGRHCHAVPCSLCNASNGSCVAPPLLRAPANLRGCMLGRAAMDHPSQFWDVDRYWYGCATNPSETRRQILHRYCAFLQELYPRRCCDEDATVTDRLPAPKVVHTRPHCHICAEIGSQENYDASLPLVSAAAPARSSAKSTTTGLKITTRVMDRSLKPVLGLFFQQPGARAFRRVCETTSRDASVRNCGPAFCLRKAVAAAISDEVLDQPFVRTEDLQLGDIVQHVAPNCGTCSPAHCDTSR